MMQYRRTENDFTLRLTPVSIADSESMYDVVAFVDPADILMRKQGQQQVIYKPTNLYVYTYVLIQLHLHTFFYPLQMTISAVYTPFIVTIPAGTTTFILPPTLKLKMMM